MSEAGDRSPGFTLLEALVVIAVMALVAAIIVPNILQSLALLSLRENVRIVQADLRVAHATAMRTGAKVTVTERADGHGYDWIGGTRQLPTDIALSMSNPIVFMADGSVMPATISLSEHGRRIPISLDAATGAVTVSGS